MKKFFYLLFAALLCCGVVACDDKDDETPIHNSGDNNNGNSDGNGDNDSNGSNGDNEYMNTCKIFYTSEQDQLIRISNNAFNARVVSHNYINGQGIIVCDAPITKIGYNAFSDCYKLETIKIPSTVTEIDDRAFKHCSKLRSINIPSQVTKIGEEAFFNCSLLESIKIPAAVARIGNNAFSQCASLRRVYCQGSTPPEITFSFSYNARLRKFFVPDSSVYLYRSDLSWCQYAGCIFSIEEENQKRDLSSITYTIDGKTFAMVKVEGDLPPYYIMQTEIPMKANVTIAGVDLGQPDADGNDIFTKGEMREFRDKLVIETGIDFRLPTPEEWQYAALGGAYSKHYTYSGGNNIDDVAWYYRNSGGQTHKVAQKQANELGLYDMSGNYAELCNIYPVDVWNVDGPAYGGNWADDSEDCLPNSYIDGIVDGKIPGTYYNELNGTKCDKKAFRFVFDAED